MKGDRVEIVVDVGGGAVREYDVIATRAGRRVEVAVSRGTVEVSEVTRSGEPVRTARFMATRVVAMVEHPAGAAADRTAASPSGPGSAAPRRSPPSPLLGLDLEGSDP